PMDPDTDDDGLRDANEFNQYDTNPRSKDTDGDGLTDGKEITRYNTDPHSVDSNNDNLGDGIAVQMGLNPKETFADRVGRALNHADSISHDDVKKITKNGLSDFEKQQLVLWLNLDPYYKEAILKNESIVPMPDHMFYLRDWDRDGILNKNDNDIDQPKDSDRDAILDRFYNLNMDSDFDTGVDQVGERGDKKGRGSLEKSRVGRLDLFILYTDMEGNRFKPEARRLLAEEFARHNISIHYIEGATVNRGPTLSRKPSYYYKSELNQSKYGIVNHVVFVENMKEPVGGLALSVPYGGIGSISEYATPELQAHVVMHEFGHSLPGEYQKSNPPYAFFHVESGRTAMNTRKSYISYTDREWRLFKAYMDDLTYYRNVTHALSSPEFTTLPDRDRELFRGPPIDRQRVVETL
ncbi:MAG: hypothetical protein ABEI86_00030, partial [Halobacteriaceae archaeon]